MQRLPKFLIVLIFLVLAVLAFSVAYNYLQISNISERLNTPKPAIFTTTDNGVADNIITQDICGEECKSFIREEIARSVASLSAQPKASVAPSAQTAPATSKQTTYIPLSGSFSTTNTDWTDAPGSEIFIDSADYGSSPTIVWEAALKIANANGNVSARLYDDTNKITVVNSEISNNTAGFMTITSGNLALWRGRNKYKVQIKSQTSQEATFGNGRIKVVY